MTYNVRYCKRCQRPLWFSKDPYCIDCAQFIASQDRIIRCYHCGKNAMQATLFYNKKRNSVYCRNCLDILINELRIRSFHDANVRKIVREDFQPIQK